MRLVAAVAALAVVSATVRRHRQTLAPNDGLAFADASLRDASLAPPKPATKPNDKKNDQQPTWWLPPASAYIAAGVPAASVGLYGGANAPTVAGTYNPYPYNYAAAGYPAAAAGYPFYGYYPTAPYAAVAGSPSGYTNVYSVLSGQYRFREGAAADAQQQGGAPASGMMPPRFAQADMDMGAETEASAESAQAQAQAAYHAHAAAMLSDSAATAAMHGFAAPQWTDFARPQAAAEAVAPSSAYSAAQRAHIMRMQEQEGEGDGEVKVAPVAERHVAQAHETTEEMVPAGSQAVDAESSTGSDVAASASAQRKGQNAARDAIDEEIRTLEHLAATL